jgi:hypothetical protein
MKPVVVTAAMKSFNRHDGKKPHHVVGEILLLE